MKLQKQAMKIVGGGYVERCNAKKALGCIRWADECRGRYHETIRIYVSGTWPEDSVDPADWMVSQVASSRLAIKWAKHWLPPM